MPKSYCPNCDAIVSIDNPRVGAMIRCRECDVELEIISTDPFEVDFPLDEEWDDEWEEDEEYEADA